MKSFLLAATAVLALASCNKAEDIVGDVAEIFDGYSQENLQGTWTLDAIDYNDVYESMTSDTVAFEIDRYAGDGATVEFKEDGRFVITGTVVNTEIERVEAGEYSDERVVDTYDPEAIQWEGTYAVTDSTLTLSYDSQGEIEAYDEVFEVDLFVNDVSFSGTMTGEKDDSGDFFTDVVYYEQVVLELSK